MTQKRLGIDVGGTKIEVAVLAQSSDIIWRRRLPTPSLKELKDPATTYQATLSTIVALVTAAESELNERFTVGVATPGALSTKTGLMKNCNSMCLNGKPFGSDLENHLQRPIRMANDADCFTLSEATDGAAAHASTVFGVIIGTGTGGGVVVNKRLLAGPNNIAGEWGHNPMPLEDSDQRQCRPCYCGRYGCVEAYLSGPAFEKAYDRQYGHYLGAADIVAHATEPGESQSPRSTPSSVEIAVDPLTQYVDPLTQYVEYMAKALAQVINILDPHVIVLGGGMSNIRQLYDRVPLRWQQYVFSDEVLTQLVPARYGDSSGVRGAAWLWNDGIGK